MRAETVLLLLFLFFICTMVCVCVCVCVCVEGATVIFLNLTVVQPSADIICIISDQACEVENQGLAILQSRKLRLRKV